MKQVAHFSTFAVAPLAVMIVLTTATIIHSQTLEWTRQLGTSESDVSVGVPADRLGNVFISGHTRGSLGGTNAGDNDAFVAKFSDSDVPEPSMLLLAALAVAPLAWRRRGVQSRTRPRIAKGQIAALTIAIVSALLCANSVHAQQAFFMGLGDLPGGAFSSTAADVSADGAVVVGTGRTGIDDRQEVFRWTRDTGMVGLGIRWPDFHTPVVKVSVDGTTIAGTTGDSITNFHAFRWRQATGMELLPGTERSWGKSVTSDGGTINCDGLLWTGSTVVDVPDLIGLHSSFDSGVISADGSTLAGYDFTHGNGAGFIWTQNNGLQYLTPSAPSYPFGVKPTALSADGSVVVGNNGIDGSGPAFRWTEQSGIVALNQLPGGIYPGSALDVSADGFVIVGRESPQSSSRIWIWDAEHGVRDLREVLVSDYGLGQSLAGWSLSNELVVSISADGRTIVGGGYSPRGHEAWIAFLGTPVPEPSVLLLAALALVPILLRRSAFDRRTPR